MMQVRCPKFSKIHGVAVLLVVFAVSIWPASPAASAGCDNSAIVEKAAKALIDAARADSAEKFSDALRKFADMEAISVFAIGKHRKNLPDARRGEFIELTTRFVSNTLKNYRLKFKAESLLVLDCQGDAVKSRLEFLGGKPPQQVVWRLKAGRIVDVNVQNAWLGQLLRTNFNSVLNDAGGNMDALFAHLQK